MFEFEYERFLHRLSTPVKFNVEKTCIEKREKKEI